MYFNRFSYITKKFLSTNQKHYQQYQDLGSVMSSVWNFCASYSDVVLRRVACLTLLLPIRILWSQRPDKVRILYFSVFSLSYVPVCILLIFEFIFVIVLQSIIASLSDVRLNSLFL